MDIHSAQFRTSSSKIDQIPQDSLPEFAFIGRSNVGKSSLINMLTGRPLAKDIGHAGQDAAYKSLYGQRPLVSGGLARIRICPRVERAAERIF